MGRRYIIKGYHNTRKTRRYILLSPNSIHIFRIAVPLYVGQTHLKPHCSPNILKRSEELKYSILRPQYTCNLTMSKPICLKSLLTRDHDYLIMTKVTRAMCWPKPCSISMFLQCMQLILYHEVCS